MASQRPCMVMHEPGAFKPYFPLSMIKHSWLLVACVVGSSVAAPAQAQFFKLPPQALALMRPAGQADLKLAAQAESAGQWEQAVEAYGRAMSALDDIPSPLSEVGLLRVLPAYGRALMRVGRLDEAETVLLRAVSLQEAATASSQGSAGGRVGYVEAMRTLQSAFALGRETARSLNQKILLLDGEGVDVREAALAPRVPEATQAVTLLAEVYARKGQSGKVMDVWQGQFSAYLNGMEATNPGLRSLAYFEAETEALHMANALAATGSAVQANATLQLALWFNTARLKDFVLKSPVVDLQLAGFQQRRLLVSALASQRFLLPQGPAQEQALVAAIASSKALGSRYSQRRRALLTTHFDPQFAVARDKLAKLDAQMMQNPSTGNAAVTAWVDWSNAYAAALAPVLPALNRAGLDQLVGDGVDVLQRTRQRLGAAGWIGFLQFTPVDPLTSALGPARYLRYTVTEIGVQTKDLGPRRAIDQAITAWRGDIDSRQLQTGTKLAQALLADLGADMESRKDWIVEPDGLLALLPFEALPGKKGGVLLESHTVRYATSMAQFVDLASAAPQSIKGTARVIADAQFASSGDAAMGTWPVRSSAGTPLRDLQFTPLPETRQEGEAVARALSAMGVTTELRIGADATANAFNFSAAPQFLHVATHGFLLAPSIDTDVLQKYRIGVLLPGMLAGLAVTPNSNGGVLMGQDIAALNLQGTELVVLSACDTGNGHVDVGEGLTSLRRATEEAGARATITSLWPVPSKVTVKLMGDFYSQLAAGRPKSQALQSAKLNVKRTGGSVRDWAGFVLTGAEK
jgi:CHAT domain-containing protein/tetratricopeptide (TPR) repeat protein